MLKTNIYYFIEEINKNVVSISKYIHTFEYYISHLDTKNPKRIRASFTEEQIRILENAFLSNSCLSPGNRRYLAKQLGLSERRVNVWFQNRRVKKYGNSRMDYWVSSISTLKNLYVH